MGHHGCILSRGHSGSKFGFGDGVPRFFVGYVQLGWWRHESNIGWDGRSLNPWERKHWEIMTSKNERERERERERVCVCVKVSNFRTCLDWGPTSYEEWIAFELPRSMLKWMEYSSPFKSLQVIVLSVTGVVSQEVHSKSEWWLVMTSGWWFGTFFIFPYIGNSHPNWLIFFRGVESTNQD